MSNDQRVVESNEQEEIEINTVDEELASIEEVVVPTKEDKKADVSQEPSFQMPTKFKDKSIEDVINSYSELEKEFGRKSNEVGELRKLTDDFLRQELDKKESEITEPTNAVDTSLTFDDLIDDPNGSIDKVLAANPRLKALEDQLQGSVREKERNLFEQKHPDWQEVAGSKEFQGWIASSKVRTNLFQEANNKYDYEMGDELFQLYKDTHAVKKEEATQERQTKLKAATTESGSSGVVKQKVYRRSDLVKLRMTDPDRFDSMQDEIMSAYAEGRVR